VAFSGFRRGRKGRKPSSFSDINVTPFVDVVLVLLVVFMVVSPMMTVGVPVELPSTSANPLPVQNNPPTSITITNKGRLFLEEKQLSLNELMEVLSDKYSTQSEKDKQVFNIYADTSIEYGKVMNIMSSLNAEGFYSIGLVTESKASAR